MKKILFLLLSLSLFLFSCAQDMEPEAMDNDTAAGFITEDQVLNAVLEEMNALISDIYGGNTRSGALSIASITPFSTEATRAVSETPPAYIVNFEDNGGFAVISTDPVSDNIITISGAGSLSIEELELAYSIVCTEQTITWNDEDEGDEDEDDYEEGDEPGGSYGDGTTYGDEHITLEWDPLPFGNVDYFTSLTADDYDFTSTGDINPAAYAVANYIYTTVQINNALGGIQVVPIKFTIWKTSGGVAPIVKTKWHQGYPYNTQCPVIGQNSYGNNIYAAAGCVNIAVSQTAAYYKRPSNEDWGVMSAFGVYDPVSKSYNNTSPTGIAKVSRYIRGVGDYLDNNWGLRTGAKDKKAKKYFKKKMGLKKVSKDKYKYSRVIDRLNKRCPVYMFGYRDGNMGHTWLVDGYLVQTCTITRDGSGTETRTLFHVNWGWDNGKFDGYYVAGTFDPTQRPVMYDSSLGDKGNYRTDISAYYKNLKTISWRMVH